MTVTATLTYFNHELMNQLMTEMGVPARLLPAPPQHPTVAQMVLALEKDPRDGYARAALADWHLDHDDPEAAAWVRNGWSGTLADWMRVGTELVRRCGWVWPTLTDRVACPTCQSDPKQRYWFGPSDGNDVLMYDHWLPRRIFNLLTPIGIKTYEGKMFRCYWCDDDAVFDLSRAAYFYAKGKRS